MVTLGEKIREARKRKRLSGSAFGEALSPSVKPASVSHWESGSDLPLRSRLGQIAAVLDLDAGELRDLYDKAAADRLSIVDIPTRISGDVRPSIDVQPHVRNRTAASTGLPVYETTPSGSAGKGFFMSSQPSHYVGRPIKLEGREDVFSFQVCTPSMENKYEVGDFVVAELHRQPKARDFALIQLKPAAGDPGRHMLLKRVIEIDESKIKVEQFNPPKRETIQLANVARLYRIMQIEDLC